MTELKISSELSLPLDVVTEAMGIVATRGAGKSYASAVLIEEAFAADVQCCVVDVTGVYHGLRSSATGKSAGLAVYVFGGQHGDLPLEATAGAFMADLVVDSGHSFVLDISDFKKAEARRFVGDFLDRLYDRKARNRTTMLLVIDEADEFAPQKPRGDSIKSLGAMETITKRGRSRGVGVVLITQRTQALNKDVLDLIETLIVMRQLAERSRDAVKGWIADKELRDDAGVIETLQALPTGTAWVWSPLRGILKRVKVRRIRTFDSYRTPKPGEAIVEPATQVELDLDKLGEKMRATVERAKASDPVELRKQIRELSRERDALHAQLERQDVVEPTVEYVEVPVLREADLNNLRAQIDRLFEIRDELLGRLHDIAGATSTLLEQAQTFASSAERTPTAPAPAPVRRRPSAAGQVGSRTGRSADDAEAKLGKGERTVLEVLAEWPDGRTHAELAFLAGYSAKASTLGVILGNLRRAGLVEPGQPIRPTAAGLEAAGGVRARPTGQALLDEWLRHPRMGEGERRVLLTLIDAGGDGLTHDELCERTGYSPQASTMGVILSKLRKLGLVEKGARRVAPEFLEAIAA